MKDELDTRGKADLSSKKGDGKRGKEQKRLIDSHRLKGQSFRRKPAIRQEGKMETAKSRVILLL